jgi:uncharacterized protein DUF4232
MTEPHDAVDPWPELPAVQPLLPPPGGFDRIARAARRRRWATATGTGAVVLVLLTGLVGLVGLFTAPGRTPVGPPPTSTSTTPGPVPTSNQPTGTPTSPPPSSSPSTSRCTADRLQVRVVPGDSAAGHIGLRVVFTNISALPCTLRGYPGVVFVRSASGSQVNQPAQPSSSQGAPTTVTLAPNHAAHADLLLVNTSNYPPATCQPTQVAGVRVTAPQDTTAVYAATSQQVCTVDGVGLAQVYPVQPGA